MPARSLKENRSFARSFFSLRFAKNLAEAKTFFIIFVSSYSLLLGAISCWEY
jgi:hypothetical protein